jgi:hypothetical protein
MLRVALFMLLAQSGLSSDIASEKNRPVTKVINMMKDMQKELAKESESDQEIYDTTVCWCETNEREKTKSISDGEARINSLKASIESLTSRSAQLNAEVARLNSEIANNEKALDTATTLRAKQLAEFTAEEKDMLQSITSMKGAITALSKHHESFLQVSTTDRDNAVMTAGVAIEAQLRRHHDLLAEVITPHQRKVVASFLQTSAPQSGEIFGIIQGMKESFENNLAQSQREETDNNNAYEDLKKAKNTEITDGTDLRDTKVQQLADTDAKNAADKQELGDTQATLESDTVFLANVKETCANVDAEYAQRTKTRTMEIEAVTKALAYLTSDEAHDLFTRTFNAKFLQTAAMSARRNAVYKILVAAGKKANDPRVSTLAIRTRIAKFGAVKFALQKMIDPLVKEKEEEIAERDFCIAELNNNEKLTAEKVRVKADSEAKLEDSRMTLDELDKTIAELKTTIADAKLEFKRAGEDRENENHAFQITVADQRATQKLLIGALKALKKFYGASLLQNQAKATAGQTPPPGFKKTSNKGGIVGVVQGVIDDAMKLEAEAIRTEEEAQKAHEDFVKNTNDSFVTWNKEMVNLVEERAKTAEQKVQNGVDLDLVTSEKKQLEKSLGDLHAQCDFALKNFELRQATRDEEIAALKQSTQILSGGSFESFIAHLPYN